MTNKPKYLTVAECLELLPVRVSEREFRREVRELGLCYRRGQIITLSEEHLAQYIKTLEAKPCQTSSSSGARLRRLARRRDAQNPGPLAGRPR